MNILKHSNSYKFIKYCLSSKTNVIIKENIQNNARGYSEGFYAKEKNVVGN